MIVYIKCVSYKNIQNEILPPRVDPEFQSYLKKKITLHSLYILTNDENIIVWFGHLKYTKDLFEIQ